jgi:hypothetical protein
MEKFGAKLVQMEADYYKKDFDFVINTVYGLR